jgi:tRNA(Ile)-lysidine synthase
LKRGAGLTGLSGMVPWQSGFQQFGAHPSMHIYRPLLGVTQAQINEYASVHLSPNDWVDDPSNTDTKFDRNFLRNDVIPLLSSRWKQWTKKVVQSMSVLNEEHTLLNEVTQERLLACLNTDKLIVNKLTTYSSSWQKQIVRHFALEIANVALSQAQLQQLFQIIHAKADARGRLSVKNNTNAQVHFERFQGQLYVIEDDQITAAKASMAQLQNNIQDVPGASIDEGDFSVKVVSQSYPIKPVGAAHSKPIKQWYKQWGIAPWERSFTLIKTRDDIDISLWCNGRTYALTKEE